MATRKTTTRTAAKPAQSLRSKIGDKLEALAGAAKAQVAKTEARVKKAVASWANVNPAIPPAIVQITHWKRLPGHWRATRIRVMTAPR